MTAELRQTPRYGPVGTALRASVAWVLRKNFNLELVRTPSGGMYSHVHLPDVYSPWNTTAKFVEIYQAVRNNTLLNVYKCWELWRLIQQTLKLQPGGILEVGVWRGGSGAL